MNHSMRADAAHDHRRSHAVAAPSGRRRMSPLGRSGLDRLLGAALVVALLWAGVYWAMR